MPPINDVVDQCFGVGAGGASVDVVGPTVVEFGAIVVVVVGASVLVVVVFSVDVVVVGAVVDVVVVVDWVVVDWVVVSGATVVLKNVQKLSKTSQQFYLIKTYSLVEAVVVNGSSDGLRVVEVTDGVSTASIKSN